MENFGEADTGQGVSVDESGSNRGINCHVIFSSNDHINIFKLK